MRLDEVVTMCERLASKYRNQQDFDDLVSVGTLKCLELQERGVQEPSTLYYRARDEMNEYFNMRSSPLTYSRGQHSRTNHYNVDDNEFVDAYEIEVNAADTFGSYEIKNIVQKLSGVLTDLEKETMLVLYNNDNDLTKAAEILGSSKQAVGQARSRIRNKLVTICDS